MVVSISLNSAPMLGPVTVPMTATVPNVATYSVLTEASTAPDKYAVSNIYWRGYVIELHEDRKNEVISLT